MPVSAAGMSFAGDGTTVSPASALGKFGVCMKEENVLRSVCSMMEKLVAGGEQGLHWARDGSRGGSLLAFAEKIYRGGLCSKESFVIALIYAQRMQRKKTSSALTPAHIHKSFLVSLMVASKFLDDFYCRNVYFASIANMSTSELNGLEIHLCFLLDFDLYVSPEEFASSLSRLSMEVCFAPSPSVWQIPAPYIAVPAKNPWFADQRQIVYGRAEYLPGPPRADAFAESPLDPTGIWKPLPRGSLPCAAVVAPLWRCDPLGAASAWHSRPYCPPA